MMIVVSSVTIEMRGLGAGEGRWSGGKPVSQYARCEPEENESPFSSDGQALEGESEKRWEATGSRQRGTMRAEGRDLKFRGVPGHGEPQQISRTKSSRGPLLPGQ